jgi:hypothetical protein
MGDLKMAYDEQIKKIFLGYLQLKKFYLRYGESAKQRKKPDQNKNFLSHYFTCTLDRSE